MAKNRVTQKDDFYFSHFSQETAQASLKRQFMVSI